MSKVLTLDDLREIADSGQYSAFAQIVAEEMIERGWDSRRLAVEMGGDGMDELVIGLLLCVNDKSLLMSAETSECLGRAFGVSGRFFRRLYDGNLVGVSSQPQPPGGPHE